MDLLPLLKSHLKSDAMLDLLETWDAQVVYEYDRTHENLPDEYWAAIHSEGVCLKFSDKQILECVFLHLTDNDGFTPIDLLSTDIPQFGSMADATKYADTNDLHVSFGQGEILGQLRDWIRFEYDGYWIHYEFRGDKLGLVTLTSV